MGETKRHEIKHRYTGAVLYAGEGDSRRAVVESAVRDRKSLSGAYLGEADLVGAYLRGAGLRGADLRGAYLRGADLRGVDFRRADLGGVDLRRADLGGADLGGADLVGADLRGVKINWQSHDLVAELLRREAGEDVDRRMVAGLILLSRDWCWDRFLSLPGREADREWTIGVLAPYVREGDGAPGVLRERAEAIGAAAGSGTTNAG